MPSHSTAQGEFTLALAHNRSLAKQAGVPIGVAKQFVGIDKTNGRAWQSRLPASKSS
jgi:hypothetical protein